MDLAHTTLGLAALLVGGGFVAGWVNILAGGGALLTMPLLMYAGLPETAANGTARLAILVQNIAAVWQYQHAGVVDWKATRRMGIPVVIGAAAGAWLAMHLPGVGLRSLLAGAAMLSGALVAFDVQGRVAARPRPAAPWVLDVALLACGFYGGLIQAGVGYLFLAALTLLAGRSLLDANVLKVVFVFLYTPVVVWIFASDAQVDPLSGAVLSVGHALGAWAGAHTTLKAGAPVIRVVLTLVLLATAVHLVATVL